MIKDNKIYCNNCHSEINRKLDSKAKRYINHFCCKSCESSFRKGKINHTKKQNEIIFKNNYAIIKIKNNIYGNFDCLVDKEDVEKIKNYYWNIRYDKRHPNRLPYVESMVKVGMRIHLHRFITNCPVKLNVDHINGNTLDNRKSNLRTCTQNYNSKNRQFAKNIYFNKRDNLYFVAFSINGKKKYLCYTRNIKEAEKFALLGRKLITENKIDELMKMKCKCILHSYSN